MQAILIGLGYDLGYWGADGKFGTKTKQAVIEYQKAVFPGDEDEWDGICGPKTWAKLLSENDAPEPAKPDQLDPRIREMEAFLKTRVGHPYIIGGQGHMYSKAYITARAKANPGYFSGGRLEWALANADPALECDDCSGLFMEWAQNRMGIYKSDMSANSVWGKCNEIGKADVRPGDILFRKSGGKMVHMAIAGYDGVYESVGTAYGVVFRPIPEQFGRRAVNLMTGKLETRPAWTHYGRPKIWA